MSDICTIKKSTLDGIAEAIQSKTGESGGMLPSEMAGKIEDLPSQPAKGLVFSEYDSDGYPHKAEFVGEWTTVPADYCNRALVPTVLQQNMFQKIETIGLPSASSYEARAFANNNAITSLTVPQSVSRFAVGCFNTCLSLEEVRFLSQSVTFTGASMFDTCKKLKSVYFAGDLMSIPQNTFYFCPTELYDFSNATAVPTLYNTTSAWGQSLSGCTIKVPQALLAEWQSATNWSALTNVTWVGV